MAEDVVETGLITHNTQELGEVKKMYDNLEVACKGAGLDEHNWDEIKDCLKMVDASMSKRNDQGIWIRKRRKNGDMDLSHPIAVAIKTIEIAKRHPEMVRINDELIEAAVLHDFFEDFDKSVAIFNFRYRGGQTKAARVMGIALDVTKATDLDRRADESIEAYDKRRNDYEANMDDKQRKFEIKDEEDFALLDNVRSRAEAKDFRPLVIKIADRIHNLQTIDGLKPDAFDRTIEQTREEFVPLALDFGLIKEAEEMRRLCTAAANRRLNSGK